MTFTCLSSVSTCVLMYCGRTETHIYSIDSVVTLVVGLIPKIKTGFRGFETEQNLGF